MAKASFEYKLIPSFRDIKGRFAKATSEMPSWKRDFMKQEGRRMVVLSQEEAPTGKTGKFKKGIRFRIFDTGGSLGFKISTPQPLGRWIMEGTKRHIIAARNVKALKFLWERGPRSSGTFTAFHFYKWVMHPGTKPNPFMSRAYRRWLPGARTGLRRLGLRFTRTIAGAASETTTGQI